MKPAATTILTLSAILLGLGVLAQQKKESPMEWFNRMDRDKERKLSKGVTER